MRPAAPSKSIGFLLSIVASTCLACGGGTVTRANAGDATSAANHEARPAPSAASVVHATSEATPPSNAPSEPSGGAPSSAPESAPRDVASNEAPQGAAAAFEVAQEQHGQAPAPQRATGIELQLSPPNGGAALHDKLFLPYTDSGPDVCAMELVAPDGTRKPHRPPHLEAQCGKRWKAEQGS